MALTKEQFIADFKDMALKMYAAPLEDLSSQQLYQALALLRKSITPILRMPLSSYHRLRISWRTMILGKESPVKNRCRRRICAVVLLCGY